MVPLVSVGSVQNFFCLFLLLVTRHVFTFGLSSPSRSLYYTLLASVQLHPVSLYTKSPDPQPASLSARTFQRPLRHKSSDKKEEERKEPRTCTHFYSSWSLSLSLFPAPCVGGFLAICYDEIPYFGEKGERSKIGISSTRSLTHTYFATFKSDIFPFVTLLTFVFLS